MKYLSYIIFILYFNCMVYSIDSIDGDLTIEEKKDKREGKRKYKQKNSNVNANRNEYKRGVINKMKFSRDLRPELERPVDHSDEVSVDIVKKLYAIDIFRDNIIFMFGFMLRLPDGELTPDQYLSLEMLFNAIKQKNIYIYNISPIINELPSLCYTDQLIKLLKSLTKITPMYMKCAAKYWISALASDKIHLNATFLQSDENLNLTAGITDDLFNYTESLGANDEMKSYDDNSLIIESLLGRVYVKIFHELYNSKMLLTQQLFGSIIRDLPNTGSDPIYEEFVSFLADISWKNAISTWNYKINYHHYKHPYLLIKNVIEKICLDDDVSLKVKKALVYVSDHTMSVVNRIVGRVVEETRRITENGLDVDLLLDIVVPYNSEDFIIDLKNKLRQFLVRKNKLVLKILSGMNRFKYNTPKDLLLAFLTRLSMRLPKNHEIELIASNLLSHLCFQTSLHSPMSLGYGGTTLWMIISVVNDEQFNKNNSLLIDEMFTELMKDMQRWNYIQSRISFLRKECSHPKRCVLLILHKLLESLTADDERLINVTYQLINNIREQCGFSFKSTMETFRNKTNKWPQKKKQNSPAQKSIEKPIYRHKLPPFRSVYGYYDLSKRDCLIISPKDDPQFVSSSPVGLEGPINLPSVINLAKGLSRKNKLELFTQESMDCTDWINIEILRPLEKIFGPMYLTKILGENWHENGDSSLTNLIILLKLAVKMGKVQQNEDLVKNITSLYQSMQIVIPYLFLPLIVSEKRMSSNIICLKVQSKKPINITIDNKCNNFDASTIPIANPRYWLLPIDQSGKGHPFRKLIPSVSSPNHIINKLVALFNNTKAVVNHCGGDVPFGQLKYQGPLLLWTLDRLQKSPTIKKDKKLADYIKLYHQIIFYSSIFHRVTDDFINNWPIGNVTIDLGLLLDLLPAPKTDGEKHHWQTVRKLLSTKDLLAKLNIYLPMYNLSNSNTKVKETASNLLKLIIFTCLRMKERLISSEMKKSLIFYRNKIIIDNNCKHKSDKLLSWVKGKRIMFITETDITQLIQDNLPYDELINSQRLAYDTLRDFINNQPIYSDIKFILDFKQLKECNSTSQLLKKYLQVLLTKPISVDVRSSIKKLLPLIVPSDRGARKISLII